jgi:hypothetical protein
MATVCRATGWTFGNLAERISTTVAFRSTCWAACLAVAGPVFQARSDAVPISPSVSVDLGHYRPSLLVRSVEIGRRVAGWATRPNAILCGGTLVGFPTPGKPVARSLQRPAITVRYQDDAPVQERDEPSDDRYPSDLGRPTRSPPAGRCMKSSAQDDCLNYELQAKCEAPTTARPGHREYPNGGIRHVGTRIRHPEEGDAVT